MPSVLVVPVVAVVVAGVRNRTSSRRLSKISVFEIELLMKHSMSWLTSDKMWLSSRNWLFLASKQRLQIPATEKHSFFSFTFFTPAPDDDDDWLLTCSNSLLKTSRNTFMTPKRLKYS